MAVTFLAFMGLDTVDLINRLEDHFSILIPNGEAAKMATIRDIVDYLTAVSGHMERADIEDRVFQIVATHVGVPLEALYLDMSLTDDLGLD